MTLEHRQKHAEILIYAGLIVATLIAYEPIRHNGFVNYDDNSYILDNAQVKSGITWESLGQAFTKPHFYMWHPLTTLSHMLDYQLFGLNPSGHHLISVAIHIVNALLLFWILKNITGAIWPSAFVAAVFALHPLQVESVAWAAERKTVLSGLFWLLTMAAYVRYTRQPGFLRYLLVLLVFGLCIMTKPVVVILPFAMLLLDYWPLERIRWGQKGKTAKTTSNQKSAGWLIAEKAPLLAMSAILAVITINMQHLGGIVQTLEKEPMNYRIANMFLSYIRYIGKVIWPSRLAAFYPHPQLDFSDTQVLICAILFILLTTICIYAGRRRKYVVVGWLWFVVTLIPMIGLVQSGTQAMANRYMYLSILGLLIIIVWSTKELAAGHPHLKVIILLLSIVVLSSAVVLSRMQVRHWQNSMARFEYDLKITKNNLLAENNYGMALLEAGRNTEAIAYFKYVLQTNKIPAKAYANLGSAYIQVGKYDLAIENLNKAIELKPDNTDVLNKLAWLLAAVDDTSIHNAQKAVEFAQRGCELTGYKDPMLLDTLAVSYAAAGRFEEAIATAEKALNIAKETDRESLVVGIQERIKFYEAGQPYRQK